MASTARKAPKAAAPKTSAAVKSAPKPRPKKAAAKTSEKARAEPKVAPRATSSVVNKPKPVVLGPVLRKKELIDTVVTRTGVKKKDAKPVVEGLLAVLGEALAEGRELILPPLGKVIVRKEKELPRGKMMIVKVRQTTAPDLPEMGDPEF